MKKIFSMMVLAVSMLVSCTSAYDDTAISNRIDGLEDRVAKLEEMCRQCNTNIASLKAIVDAIDGNDYITEITAVKDGGKEIGYTITMKSGKVITIYHGENGEDGRTPVIGVKKDTDGCYYWTVDGEWLLDEDGKKVKAQAEETEGGAKDGVTPKLRIEDDYWYVSYDDGSTWERLGKATGGAGDSMFREVKYDDEYVYLVLQDGTELTVPRAQPLAITFDSETPVTLDPDSSVDIEYTIISDADEISIEVTSSADLKAKLVQTDKLHGTIHVESGSIIDEYSKVVIFVSDGNKTLVRTLKFAAMQGDVFKLNTNKVSVPSAGGEFTVKVMANIGYYISSKSDWIEEVGKEENPKTHTTIHTFKVGRNPGEDERSGIIVFCNDNQVCIPVNVSQSAASDWASKGFYHRSLAMRFTATWCGYCPQMAVSMTKAQEKLVDKLEVVSLHGTSSDLAFAGTQSLQDYYGYITNFPTAVVDGRIAVLNASAEAVVEAVENVHIMSETIYPAATGISFSSNVSGDKLSVDVKVYALYPEQYKITVFVIEDNIIAKQNVEGTEDSEYEHDGVVRAAMTNVLGDSFVTDAQNAEKSFAYSMSIPRNASPDDLRVLVFTQREYGSQDVVKSDGFGDWYIDNCASGKVGTAVELKLAE